MASRNAIRQNPILVAAILLVGAWLILTVFDVVASIGQTGPGTYEGYVGHTPLSGWVGLGVLVAALGFLVVLYSELGEPDPLPESFPPDDPERETHAASASAERGRGSRTVRRRGRVHEHSEPAAGRADRGERAADHRYECTECGTVIESDEDVSTPHTRHCEVCDAETEWVAVDEDRRSST